MVKKTVTCINERGLHTRPSAYLTKLSNEFDCGIRITAREKTVNPKSIIGIAGLNIVKGTNVTVMADGKDEEAAVEAIAKFISSDIDDDKLYVGINKEEVKSKWSSVSQKDQENSLDLIPSGYSTL